MSQPLHYVPLVEWDKPRSRYLCGGEGLGTSNMFSVSCLECKDLIAQGKRQPQPQPVRGLGSQPPLHTPPLMNENEDGTFTFYDRFLGAGYTMEVVPQSTGNVEITIEEPDGEGHLFTLSHLDRADLLRALLHDFHYSPERGGPHDEG